MKKKAKRYQTGGVLRDRYGNPVRSGSGEPIRTTFPERSYDEQAPASMTESSDYSGRGARSTKTYGDDGMDVPHSSMTSYEPERSMVERLRRASPGSKILLDEEGAYTSPAQDEIKEEKITKPKKSKLQLQNAMARRMAKGYAKAAAAEATRATGSGASGFNFKKGGKVSSASSRADGIAQRGKTKGRIC